MTEVLDRNEQSKGTRRGFGARIAGLLGRNRRQADQDVPQPQAPKEPAFVEAQTEKGKKATRKLVRALNDTGLDFTRSFAVSFRPNGPYVKLPKSDTVIWTTYIDMVFDAETGRLQVDGQTHGTMANHMAPRGKQFVIDRREDESYTFELVRGEDGIVEDARLPEDYGRTAIAEEWPGRSDLVRMDDLQKDFAISGLKSARRYVGSMAEFMGSEPDQVTIDYGTDGHTPSLQPYEHYAYAEQWGM